MPDQPSDARPAQTRAELRATRGEHTTDDGVASAPPDRPGGAAGRTPIPASTPVEPEAGSPGPQSPDPRSSGLDLSGHESSGLDSSGLESPAPHIRRNDWRLGGRTVARWREMLLAGALVSLGVAILLSTLLVWLWPSPWAAAFALFILWIGMALPVLAALGRSRPAGLLRIRAVDVLYGLVLGGMLRVTQGWLELAAGGSGALPSYLLVDGAPPTGWWITDIVGPAVVAPAVEEFFFRGVVLIALYTVLRRPVGRVTAGIVALLMSTGLFVLVHGLTLTLTLDETISVTLLGLVCGLLVLLTGRIWGAVLLHAVFNVSYIVLALGGTYWG